MVTLQVPSAPLVIGKGPFPSPSPPATWMLLASGALSSKVTRPSEWIRGLSAPGTLDAGVWESPAGCATRVAGPRRRRAAAPRAAQVRSRVGSQVTSVASSTPAQHSVFSSPSSLSADFFVGDALIVKLNKLVIVRHTKLVLVQQNKLVNVRHNKLI